MSKINIITSLLVLFCTIDVCAIDYERDIYLQVYCSSERKDSLHKVKYHSIPTVEQQKHKLLFCDGCEFCRLEIIKFEDHKENVLYAFETNSKTKVIDLPKDLCGEFEIRLVYKECYIWGIINL